MDVEDARLKEITTTDDFEYYKQEFAKANQKVNISNCVLHNLSNMCKCADKEHFLIMNNFVPTQSQGNN